MKLIGNTPLTIAIILVAIIGTCLLLRWRFGRSLTNLGSPVPTVGTPGNVPPIRPAQPVQPPAAPAPRVRVARTGGTSVLDLIMIGAGLGLALWAGWYFWQWKTHLPERQQIQQTERTVSQPLVEQSSSDQGTDAAATESVDSGTCTEEPTKVHFEPGKEWSYIPVPEHCMVERGPGPYPYWEMYCENENNHPPWGNPKQWTDEKFCKAVWYKRTPASYEPDVGRPDGILDIPVTFTTIP